jgi:hypothetical protein
MANESWLDDLLGVKDIEKDGASRPRRALLDFTGSGVTVTDDPGGAKSIINIPGITGVGLVQYKEPCRCVATTNSALAGLLTIDGVTLNASDRVLLTGQSAATENGIYVAAAGAWTRALDFDTSAEIKASTFIGVSEGAAAADSLWTIQTNDPITINVTALVFKRMDSNDAFALRGKTLQTATVGSPADQAVIFYDLAALAYKAGQIGNASILAAAAIAVSKLAAGVNGEVLKTVAGVPSWASFSQADFAESEITPTVATSQNDYSPTGWSGATVVRLNLTADVAITSFNGAITSRRKLLINTSAFTLTLSNENVLGAAANRVLTPLGTTTLVKQNECVELFYDTTTARWRVDHFGREFWNDTNLSTPFKAWLDDQAFTWTALQTFGAGFTAAVASTFTAGFTAGTLCTFTGGLTSPANLITTGSGAIASASSVTAASYVASLASNVMAFLDFLYGAAGTPGTRARTVQIDTVNGQGAWVPEFTAGTPPDYNHNWKTGPSGGLQWFRLQDLRSGEALTAVAIEVLQTTVPAGPIRIRVYKKSILGTLTEIATPDTMTSLATTGTGLQTVVAVPSGAAPIIDLGVYTYYVAVTASDATLNYIYGGYCQFADPGPRNY